MRKKLRFIVPSLITFGILLVLFYCQGLYPFSDDSIVQVDADYQFIPVLYRIYDFLHGNGDIIYDDIGLGNNSNIPKKINTFFVNFLGISNATIIITIMISFLS